jgi:hypothetical protein
MIPNLHSRFVVLYFIKETEMTFVGVKHNSSLTATKKADSNTTIGGQ